MVLLSPFVYVAADQPNRLVYVMLSQYQSFQGLYRSVYCDTTMLDPDTGCANESVLVPIFINNGQLLALLHSL